MMDASCSGAMRGLGVAVAFMSWAVSSCCKLKAGVGRTIPPAQNEPKPYLMVALATT